MTDEKREQSTPPSPPIEGEITDEDLETAAGGTMDLDDFDSRRSLKVRRPNVLGDAPKSG
jgi:hypothetical protein